MVEKTRKVPLGIKLIVILYFACTLFYFIFGVLFSKIMFVFGGVMVGNPIYVSEIISTNVFEISKTLAIASFPFLSFLLRDCYFCMGIIAIISSILLFLIGVSLLRQISFARILAILFSIFEVGLAFSYAFKGETFGAFIHFVVHVTIIIYLIFSRNVKMFFKKN